MRNSKVNIIALTLVFVLTTSSISFAGTDLSLINNFSQDEIIILDDNDIYLNSEETIKYEEYSEGLETKLLKTNNKAEAEKVVMEYLETKDSVMEDVVNEATKEINDSEIVISNDVMEEYTEYYNVNENISFYVTPIGIYVESLEEKTVVEEKDTASPLISFLSLFTDESYAATKESKYASYTKSLYAWTGLKILTAFVECSFYYDGEEATYKGGLYGYATKGGIINPWSVYEKKYWKEPYGTSYHAYFS